MTALGQRHRLRLFLEGIEVPVISADVQAMPNAPVSASIQIPPLPTGMDILPRTLVHLFFYDSLDPISAFSSPIADPNPKGEEAYQTELRNSPYKLLFGGEVVGFQWTKSPMSRSFVLQCQDWSNYWDSAQQWNNTDLFGPGVKAIFSGGATGMFTDFLEDEGSAVLRILQTPSVQYPKLKGLLGGIVHLLEAIGGTYYYDKKYSGENIFYTLAELRLHITQMITAYEDDPTASRLIGGGYDSLFGRTLGNLGQQVSYRQAINALMGMIFHETYGQPCPYYEDATGNTPSGKTRTPLKGNPKYGLHAQVAQGLLGGISGLRDVLAASVQISPPSLDAPAVTRMKINLQAGVALAKAETTIIRDKDIQYLKPLFTKAAAGFAKALAVLARRADVSQQVKTVTAGLDDAQKALQQIVDSEVLISTKNDIPARLNQHIFRPDVWFSAPPRCNVLFPEMYSQLSYSHNFLAEPTRLLLKTNDEFFGEDELFDSFYVTPRATTVKGEKKADLASLMTNDILDHELFTGIIPVFEKMGELNIFAAQSGKVNGKKPKVGLAQRSANFLYFKYRFGQRQLSVSGRFNPYIAAGFPALIIDKWVDEDLVKRRQELLQKTGGVATTDINSLLGTHFLANVTQLSHTLNQTSGTTSMNCSYARKTDETAEFLGVLAGDQTVQKRFDKDASRISVVAALNAPQLNSMGPNMGNVTRVEDVTMAYAAKTLSSANTLELFQGPASDGQTRVKVRVPIGLPLKASDYGPDVSRIVGNPVTIVSFKAFRVTEDVPRYRKEKVDLPAEEYIRPGWYGDIWHPSLIGKAYQQFFGTGAITDEQQAVTNIATRTIGTSYEKAAQVLADAANAKDADDPLVAGPGLLALDTNSSVSAATAFLIQTYSYVKTRGLDVDAFISSYIWRPIATMQNMFGTADLRLDAQGHAIIAGSEGLHSRAVGDFDDLFGLTTPDIENIIGAKQGSALAARADTRGRKRRAIAQYVSNISFGRAILG